MSDLQKILQKHGQSIRYQKLTWMLCEPNSLFKLWLRARNPNFPAENALVVTFPLLDAVAPVKSSVPLLPFSSSSFSLNSIIADREKANAARTFVSRERATSASVKERNGCR